MAFSDAIELMDALFRDRRRPRLLAVARWRPEMYEGRRGRLQSRKRASISSMTSLKGIVGCSLQTAPV